MALTTNTQANSMSVANHASGVVVTDAGAAADTTITLGFTPRVVRWQNATDRIMLEWYDGMAANSAIRTVAAGTRTLDVSSGITVLDGTTGARGFTIKAADIPASKSIYWEAVA